MQPHSGIDLAMPEGTTLRSVADGVVDRVYDGTGLIGKGLSVKMPDGTRAIYGHMNEVKAHVGDKVNAGDIVGLSGNTGNSTGPHLHFGLKDASGNVVDPTPYADKLASISGDHLGPLGKVIAIGTESVREKAADMTVEIALGIFDALKDFLLGATLIGSAVLIILKVAGWRDGGRWAGVLIVVNILLKFLFGGV
ncbi:M23 family metallopeptidase [Neobacillus sp. DY30]|uniref:M23 family metallopeptidase n=1 Tax=Neobacillus sp. DY30 TaxID=3047871 RepID=UPI0024BFD359|nr:M23 family metallopeptidase [Neobacillus sp. DY30]WHY03451.1 M23 family metallopeptidase [Neobacillus sp. DY30]